MISLLRLALATLAGALIAWMLTGVVTYVLFAFGGYSSVAPGKLSPQTLFIVGATGSLVALVVVLFAGQTPLPGWLRPAVFGSLAGVAAVVTTTLVIAYSLGGSSSKEQVPYLHAGLIDGVPVGLLAGAGAGLMIAKKCRAEPGAAADHHHQGASQRE